MKRAVLTVMAVCMLSGGQALAAPASKIAVVDLQKVVSECKEGVAARSVVQKKAEELTADLKKLGDDLEKAKTDLEKGRAKLSADARTEKEKQLEKKALEFQKRQRDAQEELKKLEGEALRKLITRLGGIMGKMGDDGGYTAILDKRVGVFYANRDIDLTAQLIKKADEEGTAN